MSQTHIDVKSALLDLQGELRALQLWQEQRPSDKALASSQPFCIDTLNFPQWLQFVFLERMQERLEMQQPLPQQCGIAPLAQEYFKGEGIAAERLTQQLESLDEILSRPRS